MANSYLVVSQENGVTIAALRTASLVDEPMIASVGNELFALVDERAVTKLMVDFRAVSFLSSQMIGVLVSLQKKSREIDGELVLAGMKPNLKKIFEITKLTKIMTFAKDNTEGMGKFKAF
ncbi:MAG: STAS domain-containing protein [Phycisphaerae bacterium]|nr:STAS domain-containing protein [Phycisphaerae bacterium]